MFGNKVNVKRCQKIHLRVLYSFSIKHRDVNNSELHESSLCEIKTFGTFFVYSRTVFQNNLQKT